MSFDYKVSKFKNNELKQSIDQVSIEEPLEIIIKFKENNTWIQNTISVTMRTPGDDENLITGFLFNEKIIENINHIEDIQSIGKRVGKYNLDNKILVTLNNSKNVDIDKIKRNFLTNSSCGVCGKTSLDTLEMIKKDKIVKSLPKIKYKIITKSSEILRKNQLEFSKTGGIHASGLLDKGGNIIALKEDVGRHNALDKLIGFVLKKNLLDVTNQFLACSGRLNFDLVQKALMSNISILTGVGAPTSLAIDMANKFDMTLIGFVKEDRFNIYSNEDRIIINS